MSEDAYDGTLHVARAWDGFQYCVVVIQADPRVRMNAEVLNETFGHPTQLTTGDVIKIVLDDGPIIYRVMGWDEAARQYLLAWVD
jgi:hypothetical protein